MTAAEQIHQLVTVQAVDAHAAATRDRARQADLVLDVACKAAVDLFRHGQPGYAYFRLERAGMRAERILGPDPVAPETVDDPGPIVHPIADGAPRCDRCAEVATHTVGLRRLCIRCTTQVVDR